MAVMSSKDYIKAASASTPRVTAVKTNTPPQYADRQHQYTAEIRSMYDAERDYLATDYVKARVQGLDPDDFYKWNETYIRLSDVSTQSVTAFDSKQYDDFKEVLFADRSIDYIPVGAYIETMGSVWLVVNPSNMGTATTNTVIARCRTHYNFYDAYGNILSEPLVVDRRSMLSNRLESPSNIELPEGYFNVKCQLNEHTKLINDNTRFILGRNAYHVTGLTDFFEEFTFDNESVHIITFTIRREEPQVNDDMVNRIADGLLYQWSINLNVGGNFRLKTEEPFQLIPTLYLNGDPVKPTEEHPQTWIYDNKGFSQFSITEDGIITATQTAIWGLNFDTYLKENPNLRKNTRLTVVSGAAIGTNLTTFNGTAPDSLKQFSSVAIHATRYVDGEEYEQATFAWELTKADPEAYIAEISEDTKTLTLTCLAPCATPLNIKATSNTSAIASIKLEGY